MRNMSWTLFGALNIYRRHRITNHPAYRRALRQRPVRWTSLRVWLTWGTGCLMLVGMCMFFLIARDAASFLPLACCLFPVALLLTFLPLWSVPLSLTLAPVIIHERTRGTWDLLRITLLDLDTLILAKTRSALDTMRPLLNYMVGALLLLGLITGLGFAALVVTWAGLVDAAPQVSELAVLGIGIALGTVGFILFLADRAQQLLCMSIAALAAGTSLRKDARGAVLFGIGAACAVWLAEYLCALLMIRVLATDPDVVGVSIWIALFASPLPGFLILSPSPWRMLLASGLLVGAREYALRRLWQWVLHAAQRE